MPSTDRRKQSRAAKSAEVSVMHAGGNGKGVETNAKLVDCSATGFSLETASPLVVGTLLSVSGEAHRRRVHAQARVRWCRSAGSGRFVAGLSVEEPTVENPFAERNGFHITSETDVVDCYEVLQVSTNADPDTIHRVYRILAQRYHPDNPETGNEEQFKAVSKAYQVLSDPEKRAGLDISLQLHKQIKWRIFDRTQATRGVDAERRKRQGVLSALYTKRINVPEQPGMNIAELEDLLGCPREHLEFSLWYLKEKTCVVRTDNGRYSITVKGVEMAENEERWTPEHRLLEAGT